eukprot:TRINITY_DN16621_c0_g1_i1.p1 TRINITY_DN16621_c0_g1~~TRINITY_DN16621_c0_g1_i1.p1  ORF type:complete len:1019 (+),score=359.30 TRINITY_DN16621_c0_g1_i1:107-3163(+)
MMRPTIVLLKAPPPRRIWLGPAAPAPKAPAVRAPFSTRLVAGQHRCGTARCNETHLIPPVSVPGEAWVGMIPGYVKAETGSLRAAHVLAGNQPVEAEAVGQMRPVFRPTRLMKKTALTDFMANAVEEEMKLKEEAAKEDPDGLLEEEFDFRVKEDVRREADMHRLRREHADRQKYMQSDRYRAHHGRANTMPVHHSMRPESEYLWTNRVTIVRGGTGTGKSTQVPQILLDQRLEERTPGQIIVTQPRRLAAMSLARRVAIERGEEIGQAVGYQVAHERSVPENCAAVVYCTTMVLVNRIVNYRRRALLYAKKGVPFREDPSFPKWTLDNAHVVIDEVHERSEENDFLLLLLRQALQEIPTLRVTLMSATVDADDFVAYFAPEFDVVVRDYEGRLFPVQEVHIDHPALAPIRKKYFPSADPGDVAEAAQNAEAVAEAVVQCAMDRGIVGLPVDDDGAVLVFLPGWNLIMQVEKALKKAMKHVGAGRQKKLRVVRVHSRTPKAQLEDLWVEAAPGELKVILATNIAETSITVPDASIVVNSGLENTSVADGRGMERYRVVRCAKSNNKQRAGRVGRVRRGGVLHLYYPDPTLPAMPVPAMQRKEVTGLVLTVFELDLLGCASAHDVFRQCIAPPGDDKISAALQSLLHLGAIALKNKRLHITNLGRDMNKLGMTPKAARTLLYSVALGCVSPAATIIAIWNSTSGKERDALRAGLDVTEYDYVGSDASRQVDLAMRMEKHFHTVPRDALTPEQQAILRSRESYIETLIRTGVLRGGRQYHDWRKGKDDDAPLIDVVDPHVAYNRNAHELILRAVLAATQPLARVTPSHHLMTKTNCKVAAARQHMKTIRSPLPSECKPHHIVAYAHLKHFTGAGQGETVAEEITRVTPLMLAMLTPRLVAVQYPDNPNIVGLVVDDWITIALPALHAQYLMAFHRHMQRVLHEHFARHASFDYNHTGRFIDSFVHMLWEEDPAWTQTRYRPWLSLRLEHRGGIVRHSGADDELIHEDDGVQDVFHKPFFD